MTQGFEVSRPAVIDARAWPHRCEHLCMTEDVGGESELRDELLRRAQLDQQARRALTPLFEKAESGMVRLSDLDVEGQAVIDRLADVDQDNTSWLKNLVERRGWPSRSLVGDDGAAAAWLLAQHADHDPTWQRRCLDLMCALPPIEVRRQDVALLTDRVLLAEGESQVYGSQMTLVDGEYEPRDLRDPDTVDERRAAVGLSTMAEYRKLMREA